MAVSTSPARSRLSARLLGHKGFDFWSWVFLGAIGVLILLVLNPLWSIIKASFYAEWTGELGLSNYKTFFTTRYFRNAFVNSLVVCTIATLGATLIGLPLGVILARYKLPGRGIVHILAILSMLSPPFIGAYAWILLLGRAGMLTTFFGNLGIQTPSIYGPFGITLVFILKFYPLVTLLTMGSLQSVDRSLEDAAMNLGRSRIQVFRTITLPLIFPSVSTGALLVFMSALSEFGTPMVIGEGYPMLPTLAYSMFISEMGGNPSMASTVSVVLIVLSSFVLSFQRFASAKGTFIAESYTPPEVLPLRGLNKLMMPLFAFGTVLVANMPMAVIVFTSFLKTSGPVFQPGFTLDSYREVFFMVPMAIRNSLIYSFLAIALIIVFGSFVGYALTRRDSLLTRFLDILLMVPYLIPGTVLGIGYIVAFNRPPFYLTGTATIIVLAYFIRRMPYTVRSSAAIVYQIDPCLEEASVNLGVSPLKTFYKIVAPLMLPGILSGATLSWVMTINELSASLVLYVGSTLTMPVATYAEVTSGNFGAAAALASLLVLATVVSLIALQLLTGRKGQIDLV